MSTPKTSIIMPVYNTAHTVVASVQSVLAQTDSDFELLVVIDASPDNSAELLDKYLSENPDSRVQIFNNKENRKLAGARNFGLEKAKGQWIAFIDSDDFYTPDFLKKLHSASANADIVAGAHTLVRADGKKTKRNRATPGEYNGKQAVELLLSDHFSPYAWDKIYRAELFKKTRYENIKRAEDLLATLEAFALSKKIVVIDDAVYNYSVNEESLTWADLTPISECEKLITAIRSRLNRLLQDPKVERTMRLREAIIWLNTAHQAMISSQPTASNIVSECRNRIKLDTAIKSITLNRFIATATLFFKVSPQIYTLLYKKFVLKQYGIKA